MKKKTVAAFRPLHFQYADSLDRVLHAGSMMASLLETMVSLNQIPEALLPAVHERIDAWSDAWDEDSP